MRTNYGIVATRSVLAQRAVSNGHIALTNRTLLLCLLPLQAHSEAGRKRPPSPTGADIGSAPKRLQGTVSVQCQSPRSCTTRHRSARVCLCVFYPTHFMLCLSSCVQIAPVPSHSDPGAPSTDSDDQPASAESDSAEEHTDNDSQYCGSDSADNESDIELDGAGEQSDMEEEGVPNQQVRARARVCVYVCVCVWPNTCAPPNEHSASLHAVRAQTPWLLCAYARCCMYPGFCVLYTGFAGPWHTGTRCPPQESSKKGIVCWTAWLCCEKD